MSLKRIMQKCSGFLKLAEYCNSFSLLHHPEKDSAPLTFLKGRLLDITQAAGGVKSSSLSNSNLLARLEISIFYKGEHRDIYLRLE